MLINFFKICWRTRFQYWQQLASLSLIIIIMNFLNLNLSASHIWLLWCWTLTNTGSSFWREDLQDFGCLSWLFSDDAAKIVLQKWLAFLSFNLIIWLFTWQFWYVGVTGVNYIWLMLTVIATIPVLLGFSVIMASLSCNFSSNTNLLNMIILPLIAPFLIYGSGLFWHLSNHTDPSHIFAGIAVIAFIMTIFVPKIILPTLKLALKTEL